jgi:hypothetical protein
VLLSAQPKFAFVFFVSSLLFFIHVIRRDYSCAIVHAFTVLLFDTANAYPGRSRVPVMLLTFVGALARDAA